MTARDLMRQWREAAVAPRLPGRTREDRRRYCLAQYDWRTYGSCAMLGDQLGTKVKVITTKLDAGRAKGQGLSAKGPRGPQGLVASPKVPEGWCY